MIEQLPKYESYKNSGIEWIGEIPTSWRLEKAKWLFIKADRSVNPDDDIVTCFRDGQVTLRKNRRTDGFTNALKEHGYQGIRKGDLVIHAMDAFAGAIGVSDSDGKSTPVYSACIPRIDDEVNPYFYAYYMRDLALSGFIVSLAKGIRERSTDFRFNDFAGLLLPWPSYQEQSGIVGFLDKKISQIDEAIAIKQKQIDLLKERKQIIIQQAVTQGLNPDVPMKDSGVDWIGAIPEHWNVKRLKYVLEERNERSKTGEEPLFMVSQVHGLVVRADYHEKAEVAASNIDSKIVYKNDLVFNKLKAHLGVFFKSNIEFKGLVSPDYAVYKSKAYISDMKILELLFRHPSYIEQFVIRATGIVEGLIRLYTSELFDIAVPIAPENEQREIISFVESQCLKHDQAIAIQVQQIEKLKEYKITLINSAVTGKIKVTELV
ncbi:restriction endonuclease subunit S [Vibrio parahaemolyticus]|nr:restriction endonuclease subunit S [Vibrio parahaemolyticus]ELI5381996.1 restriction endonuclease subunit S [Vibrio parahaemolyticus]HCG5254984.1 restriction endonuclease subunit S [Vibrio parahaemolyticus]HCG5270873.1 restriction endonuclease subunit S [Vibrio parahaemolyticus]